MNSRYVFVGVLIVVFLAVGVSILKRSGTSVGWQWTSEETKRKGAKEATIQIVEYSDFQCPACQKAQPVLKEFLETYPDDVEIVFRHFPLAGHKWSGLTHQAAECAHAQGKFWTYHDQLFENQSAWSALPNPLNTLLQYAKTGGLNLDEFGECLSDEKVTQRILKERKMGERDQVRSTPTFFVNGERLVGGVELKERGEKIIQNTLGQ